MEPELLLADVGRIEGGGELPAAAYLEGPCCGGSAPAQEREEPIPDALPGGKLVAMLR